MYIPFFVMNVGLSRDLMGKNINVKGRRLILIHMGIGKIYGVVCHNVGCQSNIVLQNIIKQIEGLVFLHCKIEVSYEEL